MNNRVTSPSRTAPAVHTRGFSLLELLVVIVIIVSLMLIALPAFNSMQENQQRAGSASLLQQGIASARDAAVQGGSGEDTAAVFTFEPGGQTQIITCVKVGTLQDIVPAGGPVTTARAITRDVFAPIPTVEPVALPRGYMVRGFAAGVLFDYDWYETSDTTVGDNRYSQPPQNRSTGAQGYWVFPETGFYDHTVANTRQRRQTFMVRFEGGTGLASGASTDASIIIIPRAYSADRDQNNVPTWQRPDRSSDLRLWTRRILETKDLDGDGFYALNASATTPWDNPDDNLRRRLIGSGGPNSSVGPSTDIVLAKPLPEVALYDENKLASTLGVRLGRYSGSLYELTADEFNQGINVTGPKYIGIPGYSPTAGPGAVDNISRAIGRWLEGFQKLNAADTDLRRSPNIEARMFAVDRYTGNLLPVRVPAEASEGVER
ncbi:MAG: pilus assembly FimT family protein [Phycisphaerales bacterium]